MSEISMLTVNEVANALRVDTRTVRLLIKQGKLPAVKVGKAWRIRQSDIDTLLAGKELPSGS